MRRPTSPARPSRSTGGSWRGRPSIPPMRAARYHRYGGPEVVHFEDVDKPAVPDDGVLVRVHATSINPADWHTMNGTPLLARPTWGMRGPKDPRPGPERYDLLLDIAGSRSWSDMRRVLKPNATYVIVGGPKGGPLLGPLTHTLGVRVATMRVTQRLVLFFIAKLNQQDLLVLKELLE